MQDYNTYLDSLINAIGEKQETSFDFEYPKWMSKWYDFRVLTDVGFMINNNDYVEYRELANDNEVTGAFLKIDDTHYIQVSLYDDKSTQKTKVHIEIFNVSELKDRVDKSFEHLANEQFGLTMYMNKTEVEEAIKNLECFETITRSIKRK